SLGSSPSHKIAVWSARRLRCRSMQLAAALSVPSSYHLIVTLPVKLAFLTLEKGLIQSTRLAASPQNLSGCLIESSYILKYWVSLTQALCAIWRGIGKSSLSGIAALPEKPIVSINLFGPGRRDKRAGFARLSRGNR